MNKRKYFFVLRESPGRRTALVLNVLQGDVSLTRYEPVHLFCPIKRLTIKQLQNFIGRYYFLGWSISDFLNCPEIGFWVDLNSVLVAPTEGHPFGSKPRKRKNGKKDFLRKLSLLVENFEHSFTDWHWLPFNSDIAGVTVVYLEMLELKCCW